VRVKRYVVDSMPEALEKIRSDLGKDAIILNSKPVKTGGFFGLFGKQQIEVVAAVDEKVSEREKLTASVRTQEVRYLASNQAAQQAYRKHAATFPAPSTPEERQPTSQPPLTPDRTEGSAVAHRQAAAAQEPNRTVMASGQVSGTPQTALDGDSLLHELRDMREMFQKLFMQEGADHLPDTVRAIRDRLLQQEVEEELVGEIVKELLLQSRQPAAANRTEVNRLAADIVERLLQKSLQRPVRIDPSVKYAFFFGPTGVGKTTTIAKLAAESMLKEKRKIGFITADTYRIAAVEQLKTYANILNVPLEVVFSPKEIVQAMERLSGCDLIFIDTAGRNFRNDQYVQGIRELVKYGENSINYLVLSLTAKYADMKAIIRNFSDVPITQAIFTKADETEAYGALLNVARYTDLPMSYITTGQNVPDDIVVATPQLVSKMILGDEAYA
jgi:flagellar biosynthesis protein FlhF